MLLQQPPRVSIGMPAYNGENYIAAALDSVLAQTFADFELVISDNASTDATESICRSYARRDGRVRYHRNPRNLGAAANFNRAFELTNRSSDYFRWMAHDDTIAPDYLAKCVAALDADPGAVLCQSLISYIDGRGQHFHTYDSDLRATRSSDRPSERFAECILKRHRNLEIFGVIRREAMAGSVMHGSYYPADKTFVAEMSLHGRFIQLPETLFANREHDQRTTNVVHRINWAAHSNRSGLHRFGAFMLYRDYVRMVRRNVADRGERRRCYRALARWWRVNQNLHIFVSDLIGFVSPAAHASIRQMRTKLFRPEAERMRSV